MTHPSADVEHGVAISLLMLLLVLVLACGFALGCAANTRLTRRRDDAMVLAAARPSATLTDQMRPPTH